MWENEKLLESVSRLIVRNYDATLVDLEVRFIE
jgi:hypothetical protein